MPAWRGALAVLLIGLAPAPALAQISTDGSLGPAVEVTPQNNEYQIDDTLGRYVGENLFHSFSTFDVATGETATFLASHGTPARVIARVTGSGFGGSVIDGTLRSAIPGADLFLLDPNGVSFGGSARLEVDGSFYASTADRLRFDSNPDHDFVTDGSGDVSMLSIAAPVAFGFTSPAPAQMMVGDSARLSVPEGKTLSLVGGDVYLFGTLPVQAPGAHLEIASAAAPIDIPVNLASFDLASADPGALGQVDILASEVLMSGSDTLPAGSVMIRGGQFVLSGGASIVAENPSDVPAAGPIDIAVSGELRLLGNPDPQGNKTRIQSWTRGAGAAGDVLLRGDTVEVSGGAEVDLWATPLPASGPIGGDAPDATISGRLVEISGASSVNPDPAVWPFALTAGSASQLDVVAGERIAIDGATLRSELSTGDTGGPGSISLVAPEVSIAGGARVSTVNGGSGIGTPVDIQAGELDVTDGGQITSTASGGPGGDIEVHAGHLLVSNTSGSSTSSFISADDGGSILIDAGLVELLDGGQIITRAFGDTPAGTLSIVNADSVLASGVDANGPSGLFSRARASASASGTGGLLTIDTRVLDVQNGATVSSATFGAADAGSVHIDASERVTVQGGSNGFSLVSAAADPGSSGNGGAIEIDTGRLELLDGGQVSTSTFGTGKAGTITADAGRIEVAGVDPLTGLNRSGFFSLSKTTAATADGGDVLLSARDGVRIADGGIVSAASSGAGLAGDITIDGGTQVALENAAVTTQASASAGGNVEITARDLVYLRDASVATDVLGGAGGGGDVTIDPVHTVLDSSGITARAVQGAGGNIQITSDHYFQSGLSFLDASSQLGIDGTVEITSPETDVTGALASLPASYLDASRLLERDCAARTERAGSFVVRTRAAAAAPPDAVRPPPEAPSCQGGTP